MSEGRKARLANLAKSEADGFLVQAKMRYRGGRHRRGSEDQQGAWHRGAERGYRLPGWQLWMRPGPSPFGCSAHLA